MDIDPPVVGETPATSSRSALNNFTLLGWQCMVAPTSQALRQTESSPASPPSSGLVHQLPGPRDASYQMAPDLCSIIRETLQGKQVSPENIQNYINTLKNLDRYGVAFTKLWAFTVKEGKDPKNMSLEDIALQVLKLKSISPEETRMAYSALLLILRYGSIKCMPFSEEM